MLSAHLLPFVYDPANQAIPLLLVVHVFTEVPCLNSVSVMWDLYLIALTSSSFPLEYVCDF